MGHSFRFKNLHLSPLIYYLYLKKRSEVVSGDNNNFYIIGEGDKSMILSKWVKDEKLPSLYSSGDISYEYNPYFL